ncbi:2-C-methyl-D-erythritol 4-phosphate cytidylyltransferase [Clostridium cochlearium]|uniref:2-C-methyl-D-erythritol 4-phosphate cytidylyltransferase n=1 Tax=Clostridium cochlearium TaxID=1494 RepID=A0A2X2W508_CLOCO|nr:2-C-methyl-D-erythritol 4-phosphate cytidylyltransferase [Clostridium cochlearium]MBU5269798.1 2-C-methyl-D-erythritol 4-phosphate cytidylyltransferase [Clostridium cochlearium]NOH17062.1 2-C-methyl-D-erythritol 4-phosphate cytidylyltransferase [Clostridium cochlearium]SQB35948.1 2-C-methyl-D-erythritol 4-phosphate cytidylyltransferase [Clostridium cochlearium]
MSRNGAIIVAAGKGRRMGLKTNKVFMEVEKKPIIQYSIECFESHPDIHEIVIVAAENEIKKVEYIIKSNNIKKVKKVVEGGNTRKESVLNGLKAIKNSDIVVIHDGARPFINHNLISEGIKYANTYGACTCAVPPKDTIKVKDELGFIKGSLNRDSLISIQTPQSFKYKLIWEGHNQNIDKNINITDDTSLMEYLGHKVFIYDGEYTNIKITTKEDLIFAKEIVKNLNNIKNSLT